MILLGKMTNTTIMLILLYFLLSSRFELPKQLNWKQLASWIGCWFLLWLDFHWIVQTGAGLCTAVFLAWYIGYAALSDAFSFGLLFGLLRLISFALTFGADQKITGLSAVSEEILDATLLFALVAVASIIRTKWTDTPLPVLWLVPVWLISLIFCSEIIRHRNRADITLLEVLVCLWQLYTIIPLLQVKGKLETAQQAFVSEQQRAYHYAIQEEYYRKLRSKQEETRALWHDLNKYLRAAQAEADSVRALEQLGSMLDSAMEIVDVGNPILNVILNEYAHTAKAAGIELRMQIQVPEQLGISAADLYVMIGNTMDNAIEASKAFPVEQRLIDLMIRTHYDTVYFQLTNPCIPSNQKRPIDPMRGHGISNVRRCIEYYDGNLEILQKDGFFTVSIHLNQKTGEANLSAQ